MKSVRIINVRKKRRNHPDVKMSHSDEHKVVDRERVTFYMKLLRRLNHMGTNVALQMFFVSLVSFFWGLSRRGMAIAAQMHTGYCRLAPLIYIVKCSWTCATHASGTPTYPDDR